MNQILYKLNPWWEGRWEFPFVSRHRYKERLNQLLSTRDIVFITGLRRVGKTTLMKELIQDLLESERPESIFYVTLDAYGLETYSIHDIVTQYRTIHRIPLKQKVFLFLDEVAFRPEFQRELKDFYDNENAKIYASSSSASLLRDRKAFLTGRTRTVEILPLDFDEFLLFKNAKVSMADSHLLEDYFYEYMQTGGIPEYVLHGDIAYLSELIDGIIYKDIIAFHNVKDSLLIKDYFRLLMERAGKTLTLNKISKILGISVDTARRYLEYFRETYLIYTIERCGKLNERLRTGKKVYSGDVGIRNLATGFRDKGAVFENLVFLKIKQYEPCYVYEKGYEIDFRFRDTILEVKLGKELEGKQRALFENVPANTKKIITSWKDYLDYFEWPRPSY